MKNGDDMVEFEVNPFYLYPIEENLLGKLFVNRENELKLARSVFDSSFENPMEVSVILGGIGIGKSSMLNYIQKMGKEEGYEVGTYTPDDDINSKDIYKEREVLVIDDLDKETDEKAIEFYRNIEGFIKECKMIFFTDRYHRDDEALDLREFSTTQKIPLPQGLRSERLKLMLEERMERCVTDKEKFEFPFTDKAIEQASMRSSSNLRAFLRYTKSAWGITEDKEKIGLENMTESIIMEDRALIGKLDITDLRILWYSTIGDLGKGYLAEKCNISSPTLSKRIDKKLSHVVSEKKSGKKTMVTSLYKDLPNGKEILEEMLKSMDISKEEIT